MMFVL
jgi:hypothetical protein